MKKNKPERDGSAIRIILSRLLPWVAAYAVALVAVLAFDPDSASLSGTLLATLEAGKVAEEDVVAERDIVWIDGEATRLRREAVVRLVLPVFVVDDHEVERAMEAFRSWRDAFISLREGRVPDAELALRMKGSFPGAVPDAVVESLIRSPKPERVLTASDLALSRVLSRGVAAMPEKELSRYNPDYIELRSWDSGSLKYDRVPLARVVTPLTTQASLAEEARLHGGSEADLAAAVAYAFAVPTAFFDAARSEERAVQAERDVGPVLRRIAKGETIVRKGLVVTQADIARLREAMASGLGLDLWTFGGRALSLAFALAIAYALFSAFSPLGRKRDGIVLLGAGTVFAVSLAIARFLNPAPDWLHAAVFVPVSLFTMAAAALYGQKAGLSLAISLGAVAFAVSGGDGRTTAFVTLTAMSGALVIRGACTRIDLVRAGAALAGLAALASVAGSAIDRLSFAHVAQAALWSALNGFVSGLISLALLPLVEQALNAPTVFRLIELSDLNAPAMRKLLVSAPGTYGHSVSVAHLAESACRAIGANALLARVGAYYHDLGKTEQPEYFVENQNGYNRHDEMNPRLSATVIRSHVKLGVEKTRALRLPDAVIDIVGQHHGDSVIRYFYDRALKSDPEARADDFAYPGERPASKEAAVVMIADAAEAATRAMKNPTLARIDQLVGDIVLGKLKDGQFDRCEITMKELDVVRNAIVRMLTGSFHLRVEYPEPEAERADGRERGPDGER